MDGLKPRACILCGAPEVLRPATALMEVKRSHDYGSMGPCMKALTAMQQRFVMAMMEMPKCDYTEAARVAGYAEGNGLKVTAHRLAHDQKVQAALHEEAQKRLHGASNLAVTKLLERMVDGEHPKEQMKAIEMVLNRSGLHAKTEHKVTVEHTTDDEKVARIRTLAAKMGLDPKSLLGEAGIVVDADFTEVTDAQR